MSKLGMGITVGMTKRHPGPPMPLRVSYIEELPEYGHPEYVQCRLGIELHRNVIVLRGLPMDKVREGVARDILEHVFGEFRIPLLEAVSYMRAGEIEKAAGNIHSVLDSMFKEF